MSVIFNREIDTWGHVDNADFLWVSPLIAGISPLNRLVRLGTTASLSTKRAIVNAEGHTRGNGHGPLARKPISGTERS